MKKKILFIMPSMFIGGAERSLLGLLEAIDYTQYDVSLFLYRHEGEFLAYIPDQVNLLPPMKEYGTFDVPIRSLLFSRRWRFGLARLISKAALKIHCLISGEKKGVWMSMQYTARYLLPLLPEIPGEYDLGVMFLGVADPLIHKVKAKKKVTWCHTDYDTLYPNKGMDRKTYEAVDRVVFVSDACREKMTRFYPALTDKTRVIENILGEKLLLQQAEVPVKDMPHLDDGYRLLSIGRFSEAKNFDNVPNICKSLLDAGLHVKWYLIGYGGDEELIRQKILEAGMEEHVILLGKKENPYPYIKACDLYVQPSRYEGKCVTVREAQTLGKPVVITRYATSASQLEEGVDGVIVPMDNEGCAAGIADLLRDPARMERLSQTCKSRDYSNRQEVEKLYLMMG
ncbi:MAG: glycosyltransferase [Candidatus Limivicinus sp.]|nr:glycosyltransferase [Clostridiales bacterium]MDY6133839.1 glycosyltransferase [Candidatus Limivicinus sp.]